jgi:hypothetical protein
VPQRTGGYAAGLERWAAGKNDDGSACGLPPFDGDIVAIAAGMDGWEYSGSAWINSLRHGICCTSITASQTRQSYKATALIAFITCFIGAVIFFTYKEKMILERIRDLKNGPGRATPLSDNVKG